MGGVHVTRVRPRGDAEVAGPLTLCHIFLPLLIAPIPKSMNSSTCQNSSVVILGGGLAGLSTLWHLQRAGYSNCALYEKESRPGGLVRSEVINGFTFDYTGHLLHFHSSSIQSWVQSLLKGNLHHLNRASQIFSHGIFTRYPFQSNLRGLPAEVIKECILEYVRAEGFRVAKDNPIPPYCGPSNFEDWTFFTFGKGIARHFMLPYNEKLWTLSCRELSCNWMGRFVPNTSLEQILEGILSDEHAMTGYNASFFYPQRGGIEELPRSMAAELDQCHYSRECSEIDLDVRTLRFRPEAQSRYNFLVTTIPLPVLIKMCRGIPESIQIAGQKLRWVSVLNLNLGLDRPASDEHWIYVPESEWPFYRMGFPHNFSRALTPPNCGSISVEVAYSPDRPPDERNVMKQVKAQLQEIGILKKTDKILAECILNIPCAYVIHDQQHAQAVATIQNFLRSRNVHSIGRYGAWEYSSMEDALLAGAETAHLIQRKMRVE